MVKKTVFTGAATALVTPFNHDLSLNLERLEELAEEQIYAGISALVVCGTTGEASTLSDEEQEQAICAVVEAAAGKVPVIAGVASNCTLHSAKLAKAAEKSGADAVLAITPYYNKTSQQGLIKHFGAISDAVNLPMIVYNVPQRTGMDILPETYLKLTTVKNFCGIKEASGNMTKIAKSAAVLKQEADIYSGSDEITVPIMSLGGKGVISVVSNIRPQLVSQMCSSFLSGNLSRAAEIQLNLMPLIDALFSDVNPIPIKYAMNYLGKNVGPCRLPLCELGYDKRFLLEILLNH